MEYVEPIGEAPDASYDGPNFALGTEGDAVPAEAIEHPQREIVNAILAASIVPSGGDLTQLTQAIQAMIATAIAAANATLAGTIRVSASANPGPDELLCNGAAVSRTTYANLFAAIGTTWGAGNGSTTFNVPDLRGHALVAAGAYGGLTSRTLAGRWGEETHKLVLNEMPNHQHTVPIRDAAGVGATFPGTTATSGPSSQTQSSGALLYDTNVFHSKAIGDAEAHNVCQPSVGVNCFIHT